MTVQIAADNKKTDVVYFFLKFRLSITVFNFARLSTLQVLRL